MASAQKANSIKLSVNDEDKIQDKFRISSSNKIVDTITKEKISKEKIKPNILNNEYNNKKNLLENPNFNISSSNSKNNNFAYINSRYKYNLNLNNNKNEINNQTNSFASTFNSNNNILNHGSQKQLKNKINIDNNNSPFNISNNSKPVLKFSFKNRRENNSNNNNYNTNHIYLATEPEIQVKENYLSTSIKNIEIKKTPYNLESSNSIYTSYNKNKNYIPKKLQNQSKITSGVLNTAGGGEILNNNKNLNDLEFHFKKSSELLNSLNKPFSPNIHKTINNSINNSSSSKQKSNSKTRKNNIIQDFNSPNKAKKNLDGSFISKNIYTQIPLETYSSHNDFIDEFFFELQNYNNNSSVILEDSEKHIIDSINNKVLSIFDNIFKKIITGQKPMESLDIDIKKKLNKYSETWKKFLSVFEKNSIKYKSNQNPSYINNIDLSTKNVINHNHNIHNTESCLSKIKNNKNNHNHNSNTNENRLCDLNCYSKINNELEEKFTNLMQKEVTKVKGVLKQKEKIIEDLHNQINIKNSYISEMQQGSVNNPKSKDLGTSNRLLRSENFSRDIMREKASEKNISDEAQSLKNNLQPNNNLKSENKNENEKLNMKKNKESKAFEAKNAFILEEAEEFSLKKKPIDTFDDQTELLLYDQKQFIRERRLLVSENKSLFEKINEMEKLLNFQKEKEIKLMKLLFFLNKQGIPIDEIIQTHILPEKSGREENSQLMRESNQTPSGSYKSMESLMYMPITLDKPMPYVKPQIIPVLDFTDINNKFNMEYDSCRLKSNSNCNDSNNNCVNKKFTIINDESFSSFIDLNKIDDQPNYDNSIINDISKLDHKKNRGNDLKINLNPVKNKENAYMIKSLNENAEQSNTFKQSLNMMKLNLNTDSNLRNVIYFF